MASVYVAGPVLRGDQPREGVKQIYRHISEVCKAAGWDAMLPRLDHSLDELEAPDFTSAIFRRIRSSEGVVSVLVEDDRSVPIEAAAAAFYKKPQVLIVESLQRAPRLLKGLPFVEGMVDFSDTTQVRSALSRLVRSEAEPRASV